MVNNHRTTPELGNAPGRWHRNLKWNSIIQQHPTQTWAYTCTVSSHPTKGTYQYPSSIFRPIHRKNRIDQRLLCPSTTGSRRSKSFSSMKVPIAGPLLKVIILEGLYRSDKTKYNQAVINAYSNNLSNSIEQLQAIMEIVEGLRSQQIIDEYTPSSTSGVIAFGAAKRVDDLIIAGSTDEETKKVIETLIASGLDVKDLGFLNYFIGIHISRKLMMMTHVI